MEFEKRKAAILATMNSPESDKSPKGNIDAPIIPLLNTLNSHPSYFTTSSCSGRISIFSQPTTPSPSSKKKAKGGTWLFISHDYPVDPNSVVRLLFPSPSDPPAPSSFERQEPGFFPGAHALVFRFEPLIIAVECRDIDAAQSLVSLAISCGFRESGITSISKRVIIAIRCSIRLEVPLGDTEKLMVSAEYVKYLVELANEKMEANRKRTDNFLDALFKNGFSRHVQSVKEVMGNGGLGSDEESVCVSAGKLESWQKSSNNHGYNDKDGKMRELDHGQRGSSQAPGMNLLMSTIPTVGEPAERLFLWGHSASAIGYADHKKVLIFGGFGGIGRHARRNDLLLLDPEGWKIEAVNVQKAPSPRLGHTSTIVEDCMYVIGGRADPLNILNDVWVFRMGTGEWSLLHCTGTILSPRHRHAAAVVGSKIYIFGGIHNDTISSSLYVFDTQNLEWSEIIIQGEWPSPRHSHSMLAHGTYLYMFGGHNGEKALGDLYTFNVQTHKWKKVKGGGRAPSARFSHSMFVYNNYIGIIGGCPVNQRHKELSLLDLQSYSWKHIMVESIGSDLFVRSTANVIGDELIMIGGGASCYAFGTKFSESVKINLLPLMSLGDNSFSIETKEVHIHYHGNRSIDNRNDALQFSHGQLKHESLNCNVSIGDSDVNAAHQTAASYWILRLERKYGKLVKDILKHFGWLDLGRKVRSQEDGRYICFPVLECFFSLYNQKRNNVDTESEMLANLQPLQLEGLNLKDISESAALDLLIACGATKLADDVVNLKKTTISPLKLLKEAVSSLIEQRGLPLHLLEQLPSRWDRLGDIIVLPVSSFRDQAWELVEKDLWPIVAQSLGTRRLARQGRIAPTGTRDSTLEILVGDNGWVEHRENGILYSFDATKCMFSWGNLSEKFRMARLDCKNEVVVDLFAGIGYFTLPFLVRASAKLAYACEWNPHAVEALRRNLHANSAADRCVILEGDNRVTAPVGVADRVSLGLLPTSEGSWVTAVRALRSDGGILHIHGNVKDSEERSWVQHVSRSIRDIARSEGHCWDVSVVHVERVKWYAPHIRHLVADVRCRTISQRGVGQFANIEA